MTSPAVVNRDRPTSLARIQIHGGSTVNADIPVGTIEPWRTAAIQKIIALGGLADNWDARGSAAPSRSVREAAIDFLMKVPNVGAPRIVPVSGGGYHFEWSVGGRELEISLDEDARIDVLMVVNGMPLDDDPPTDLATLFGWLVSL